MKRRRTRDPETDGVYIPISLKISSTLLEKIDDVWKNNDNYTGRAHVIEDACKYYLSLEPCSRCGKLHEKTANLCSFCSEKFEPYDTLIESLSKSTALARSVIKLMGDAVKDINLKFEKIDWFLDKQDTKVVNTIYSLTHSIYVEFINSKKNLEIMYDTISGYKYPEDSIPLSKFLKSYRIFNAHAPIEELLRQYPEKTHPIQNQAITVAYFHDVCEVLRDNPSEYRTDIISMFTIGLTNYISIVHDKYMPLIKSLSSQLSTIESIIDYVIKNSKN